MTTSPLPLDLDRWEAEFKAGHYRPGAAMDKRFLALIAAVRELERRVLRLEKLCAKIERDAQAAVEWAKPAELRD